MTAFDNRMPGNNCDANFPVAVTTVKPLFNLSDMFFTEHRGQDPSGLSKSTGSGLSGPQDPRPKQTLLEGTEEGPASG